MFIIKVSATSTGSEIEWAAAAPAAGVPGKGYKYGGRLTGCKLCHCLLLGLLTATLAVLGLQLTPTVCPERQLSINCVSADNNHSPNDSNNHYRTSKTPTDKGSQATGGQPLVTSREPL